MLSFKSFGNSRGNSLTTLFYQISGVVLLVAIQTSTKFLNSAKILRPRLSENFSFTLQASNDKFNYLEKEPILAQKCQFFQKNN